ncbi:thiamine phosphate synthase [Bombella sp. TMW 2.2543]|uniref:Thiamine phosphate synthase n=1 Tax=Bombella pluederhausensis TaxID=2967336 RepID=A0ABT3WI45_9PROT|nr:thiamine phosphate synthase [Bombella pluederhausensis]MCX5618760.1 thiamine phosphate synthase [Bombella pluederhausensis]
MNHCDLYPVIPSLPVLTELQEHLPSLLAQDSVTALRLCFDQQPDQKQLETLRQMVWKHDVALILAPAELSLLKDISLREIDGIHLSSPADVKPFAERKDRPKNLQIGCTCLTLDDAMSAGERGADYVSLPATGLTALTQWSLIAELPAVAENVLSAEEARAAAEAGADFLAISLTSDSDAMERFKAISAALSS